MHVVNTHSCCETVEGRGVFSRRVHCVGGARGCDGFDFFLYQRYAGISPSPQPREQDKHNKLTYAQANAHGKAFVSVSPSQILAAQAEAVGVEHLE